MHSPFDVDTRWTIHDGIKLKGDVQVFLCKELFSTVKFVEVLVEAWSTAPDFGFDFVFDGLVDDFLCDSLDGGYTGGADRESCAGDHDTAGGDTCENCGSEDCVGSGVHDETTYQ